MTDVAPKWMRCTRRLEIAVWLGCVLFLGTVAVSAYHLYLRPPPLEVLYYGIWPTRALPGATVRVVTRGIKNYTCPVTAKWFLEDASGRLFSWIPPHGFNEPSGRSKEWIRSLTLPALDVAPGPAQQWEVVTYDCPFRDHVVYSPRARIFILPGAE